MVGRIQRVGCVSFPAVIRNVAASHGAGGEGVAMDLSSVVDSYDAHINDAILRRTPTRRTPAVQQWAHTRAARPYASSLGQRTLPARDMGTPLFQRGWRLRLRLSANRNELAAGVCRAAYGSKSRRCEVVAENVSSAAAPYPNTRWRTTSNEHLI